MVCFIRVRLYSIILYDSVSTVPFPLLVASDTLSDDASLDEEKDVLCCLVFIAEPFINDFGTSSLCQDIHGTDSVVNFFMLSPDFGQSCVKIVQVLCYSNPLILPVSVFHLLCLYIKAYEMGGVSKCYSWFCSRVMQTPDLLTSPPSPGTQRTGFWLQGKDTARMVHKVSLRRP